MTDYYVHHEAACRLSAAAHAHLGKIVPVQVDSFTDKSREYQMVCAGMAGDQCIFIDNVHKKADGTFSLTGRQGLEEYADYREGKFMIPAILSQEKAQSLYLREVDKEKILKLWEARKQ